LYVQQNFGDKVSVLFGKLNLVEFARATPLRGGGGVDTFWNVNLATPITGLSPPTIFGGQVRLNTQPVSFCNFICVIFINVAQRFVYG
jgi:porin